MRQRPDLDARDETLAEALARLLAAEWKRRNTDQPDKKKETLIGQTPTRPAA